MLNMGPSNPANLSGSMTKFPGNGRLNFNALQPQQGRMAFRPPQVQQPFSYHNGMASPQPNYLANPRPNYLSGNTQPYQPVRQSPMIGQLAGSTQAPQMGLAGNPQMPINPALGILPSFTSNDPAMPALTNPAGDRSSMPVLGGATTNQGFNEKGLTSSGPSQSLMGGATTGMENQLPSFTQFQEPSGAPPSPPLGNPMTNQMNGGLMTKAPLGTGINPSANIWQKLMSMR